MAMETVSVSTSISNSVCNIYIHGQPFRQKLLIFKAEIKKKDVNLLNVEITSFRNFTKISLFFLNLLQKDL